MSFMTQTERLEIRSLSLEDAKALKCIWGNKEVMCYCGGPIEGENRLCRSVQYYQAMEASGSLSAYAVLLKLEHKMIGVYGFNAVLEQGVYEMVFHFDKEYWNQGYATEAGRAIIDYLKKQPSHCDVMKIGASISSVNKAAVRVLEKCGFEYMGQKWYEDTKQYEPYFQISL